MFDQTACEVGGSMQKNRSDVLIPNTPETLLVEQTERRKNAVQRAMSSKFFEKSLSSIDLDNVIQPEEWAKIPILNKEQLREMSPDTFYDEFCIGTREDITEFWRSGGSTGKPLFYPRTKEDIRYATIGFQRSIALAGIGESDIAHMSLPLGIHPAGHMMCRSGSDMGVGMIWAGGGNTLPSLTQLDLINMFNPSAWIGMASYGIQLGNLARSEGLNLHNSTINKILCSAEPLSDSKRDKLSSLWGADVTDCYGMTEVMMLGAEDQAGQGFRFWSDFCYPEVLNETTLEPVEDGEQGLLVVTSLVTNNATPFLRWNSGDVVTMRNGVVTGSGYDVFPVIKHTHRTAGFVKVRGINIGFGDLEDLFFEMNEISDFRVEVNWECDKDQLDIFAELADDISADTVTEQITGKIQRVFGLIPRVFIEEHGNIAKAFEGAFKPARIIDKRS